MADELAFIAGLRALPLHPGARGLTDDAAVLEVGGETLVLTHDAMAEGVHYLAHADPNADMADVAWKLVASNLSDLAAKGAEPVGVLLGHVLGPKTDDNDDARFLAGLEDVLTHYNVPLLGGDTIAAKGPRTLGLTAIGRATHTPVPSRAGAQPADQLYVNGQLGAAMLGYETLRDGTGDGGAADPSAYLRPMARLAEGIALAPQVTAMMDISDGLLLDAFRMAEASGVTLALDSALVPCAVPASRRQDALRWGDDYELLFALPAGIEPAIPATRIGEALARGGAPLVLDGEALSDAAGLGYQHQAR